MPRLECLSIFPGLLRISYCRMPLHRLAETPRHRVRALEESLSPRATAAFRQRGQVKKRWVCTRTVTKKQISLKQLLMKFVPVTSKPCCFRGQRIRALQDISRLRKLFSLADEFSLAGAAHLKSPKEVHVEKPENVKVADGDG